MPELVHGHLRFTADDFTLSDYQEKVEEKYKKITRSKLIAQLQAESAQLALMHEPEVLALFHTEKNIKQLLGDSLAHITALAAKEGYTLTDLLSQTAMR